LEPSILHMSSAFSSFGATCAAKFFPVIFGLWIIDVEISPVLGRFRPVGSQIVVAVGACRETCVGPSPVRSQYLPF
jgi:hypothetical protein